MSALLLYFIFAVKNEKYISSVVIRHNVICQSLIESCNFLSWSEMNANNLSSTAKLSCRWGPLTREMNLIQLSLTVLIKCLRCFALWQNSFSEVKTINCSMSWMTFVLFQFAISSQVNLNRSLLNREFFKTDCFFLSNSWQKALSV